jgi:hypothetical protein
MLAAASAQDRAFAALILADLESYIPEWPQNLLQSHVADVADWISRAESPMAYGLFTLLNALRNKKSQFADEIVNAVDPVAVGKAISSAAAAAHLGELIKTIGWRRTEEWKATFGATFDSNACLSLASSWPASEPLHDFATFCYAISTWNEDLALEMVERFIPSAQAAFAENPISAFRHLDEIVSHVLRVSDPLGAYVGRHRPNARHLSLARAMCANLKPKLLAAQLSLTHKRDLQTATFFLAFLKKAYRSKFDSTVTALDWGTIENTIGDDWRNLPHEAEIFLAVVCSNKHARDAVADLLYRNLHRIVDLPPRLALIAPAAAFKHVESKKVVRLAQHSHYEWGLG